MRLLAELKCKIMVYANKNAFLHTIFGEHKDQRIHQRRSAWLMRLQQ